MSELNYKWNSDDKEIDEYKDGHYTTCHSGQEIADEMNAYRKALNNSINKAKALERQLAEARELTNKFIKRTEGIIQALVEDGSEEGHSEFFYRMNSKEQVLHEGFLRKLNKLKEKG